MRTANIISSGSSRWRPAGLLGGSLALAATAAAYPLLLRPWHLRWGATDVEAREPLPGDEIIPAPVSQSTRAVTIHAPVERVWPWVVQMGQGRGGLYSYTWLENLFGHDLHNAERIVPQWQHLEGGDEFRLASAARYPTMALVVAAIEPYRLLLLRSPNVGSATRAPADEFGYTWAFVLRPIGATDTRFIARGRFQGPRSLVLPTEFAQFVMERGMLRGLKQRAERIVAASGAAPPAPHDDHIQS
jgi:hypothetical protein